MATRWLAPPKRAPQTGLIKPNKMKHQIVRDTRYESQKGTKKVRMHGQTVAVRVFRNPAEAFRFNAERKSK